MTSLYKYVADPKMAPWILGGSTKFTPVDELNDPSELAPVLDPDAVNESLIKLQKSGYDELGLIDLQRQGALIRRVAPRFEGPVPRTASEATELIRAAFYDRTIALGLEQMLMGTAQEIAGNVGLWCLSRRNDSLPMWAHYAANATGFVVEYRNIGEFFVGDETGILAVARDVMYPPERSGVTFEPRSHEALFFEKFSDWSYEEEVRVVMPLDACRAVVVGGRKLYFVDLPRSVVVRLILGWRMPADHAARVRDHVTSFNPQVDIVRARFVRGHVEFAAEQ
jgi:hypothetical protein